MDLQKLYDSENTAPALRMHPALDFVDGTVYVTVHALLTGADGGVKELVLSSDGEVFTLDEWALATADLGFAPYTTPRLDDCAPRWTNAGIRDLAEHALTAPGWRETYEAIHKELDARLQVCDPGYLVVLTLYAMMTYFHPLFDFLPILHLRGPAESGKTRAGTLVARVGFNGAVYGTSTGPSLFRNAHRGRYTQVITECDHLATLGSGDTLVQQFQTACSKAEATVEVTEGGGSKDFKPTMYYSFCPRVMLSTRVFKSQPLRSRCIRLDIVKSGQPDETKLRTTCNDDAIWAPLRDRLYRLLLGRWKDVQTARDGLKRDWRGAGAPTGRTFEKWLPLATMAALVSDAVLGQVKEMAAADMVEQQADAADTFEAILFKFMAHYVTHTTPAPVEVSADQLWEAYSEDYTSKGLADWRDPPAWLKATDTTVSVDQLRQWVRGRNALVRELRRLNLLPPPHHVRGVGNRYALDRQHILDVAAAYMGDNWKAA